MARKKELEELNITWLALLCGNVAASSAIDKQIAVQAANLKLEWVQLAARETPPSFDFKAHEQILKEKAGLKARMVELLVRI